MPGNRGATRVGAVPTGTKAAMGRLRPGARLDKAALQRRNKRALEVFLAVIPSNGVTLVAKSSKTLDDLFHETLKDIYFAEKKILTALPKMAKAAQNEDLKAAFTEHREQTQGHVERLDQVFGMIDKRPQGKNCPAIIGIIEEGEEIIEEYEDSPALDAGLLASAQAVEHYEITRYGTLRTWAEELGLKEAVTLLQTTLDEEEETDVKLTELAEDVVNQEAQEAA
jgi:ferritin-like metal-binding protein YciE